MATLIHIKDQQIKNLAAKTKCSPAYVRMILRGARDNKSKKARLIYLSAEKLNALIEKAQSTVNKDLQVLDAE